MKSLVRTIKSIGIGVAVVCGSHAGAWAEDAMQTLGDNLTIRELIRAGGAVMVIIVALSVVVVALAIVSFQLLRRHRFVPDEVRRILMDHIINGRIKSAREVCDERRAVPLCMILGPALKKVQRCIDDGVQTEALEIVFIMENVKKSIEHLGVREFDRFRSLIAWFSNIGVVAPMLGLLGTVLGMIKAFGAIAYKVETGKPVLLSSAISQAMVTTAGGLVVGILSMMFFYYFTTKMNQVVGVVEDVAESVTDELEQQMQKKRKK